MVNNPRLLDPEEQSITQSSWGDVIIINNNYYRGNPTKLMIKGTLEN